MTTKQTTKQTTKDIKRRQQTETEGKHQKQEKAFEILDFSSVSKAFLLCCYYKIDPYKPIVQKQSVIFAVRVDLSLVDDGS